ncbi:MULTISPECIES: hypothetical protein [unclassified Nocardiopsis]|uniref:hypothetical protein n=1 Tax=unclassified Nocardiopsis TaxID=2649073 RepID=UPI0011613B2C|nr:hypothetical protein [Nocardiopsis sp. TSRI0078]
MVTVAAAVVLLVAGCTTSDATVTDKEIADDARGPFTMDEVAAVEEFLEDDSRGPVSGLVPTASGVLALFEDGVASFDVDPVAEAWHLETSGPVHDVSVGVNGKNVLLRHGADLGPLPRNRTMLLDVSNGRVIESSTGWGETVPGETHLMREVWVTAESEGVLVARSLADSDVVWERDLAGTCSSGSVDDVDLASAGIQLLVAYACVEDGSSHAAMLDGNTGDPFWEESWQDASAPRVHAVHEHTVPGGPDDPIARMLNEGLSGGFLFVYGSEANGVKPFLPEPWRSAPGVGDYADEPLQDFEEAPHEIVLHSSPRAHMHDLVLVQAARWLAEDESVPFSKEDIDDSLLIDGELVQNPDQWRTGADGYIGALEDELAEAFP